MKYDAAWLSAYRQLNESLDEIQKVRTAALSAMHRLSLPTAATDALMESAEALKQALREMEAAAKEVAA